MAAIIVFLLIFLPLSISQSPPSPPVTTAPSPPATTVPTPPAITTPTPPAITAPSRPPPPSPPPVSDACNGIFLSYTYIFGARIPPLVRTPSEQPYSFNSELFILNNDAEELKSWRIFVGFQHNEFLVSATNAILADGTSIPTYVSNGTVFSGFPSTDLKTAIETAGDIPQMSAKIALKGTQFGVALPAVPMPSNITLQMDGYDCRNRTMQGTRVMNVCCIKDLNFKVNITVEGFLPRQTGDLTIDYDVLKSYGDQYDAEVKIANHNPLGRLDYWMLSWDWMREEFILEMKGAHPSIGNTNECLFGPQGTYYKELDFSTIASCEKRPTIVDLPVDKTNDSTLGLVPNCCRNGTILPTAMDPSKSISAFRMKVKKMPPDLNRTELFPPQNFQINGTLNPEYKCGPPIRVSPNQFPDPSGLPYNRTAVATWQVVCNITQAKKASPKCCVSFSSFYNDSVIPCRTCACGCPTNPSQVCSATTPALLLRPDTLLVPFENRTAEAKSWANIIHNPIPDPLPCGDNCGVSINWHINTDYRGGWTARVTLFNWGETNFADWFAAMEFRKATPGFEKMYSFNATAMENPNSTIFMQGLEGLNYLVAEVDGADPIKNPRVPGKQQSVISFTKKLTPGINVVARDGFPSKVFFNGEECSLPTILPSGARKTVAMGMWSLLLSVIVLVLMEH